MNNPLVSVIVPTYNSAAFLDACLKSIQNQTYPNTELIVVDNNSTDNTKQIAKKYTKKVYNRGPERSAQRNYGVKKSEGEYLLIIDSDMELTEDVITACVEKAQSNNKIKGVVIPEESFGKGFWAQCKKLERSFYVGVDWMEAARFFRRQTFGLFKTCRKKFYYAQLLDRYQSIEANKWQFSKQSNPINRYKLFLSHPKLLFRNPLIGAGMLLMKTSEFLAGGCGYMRAKRGSLWL